EDGIRDYKVTGVQTCALPIWLLTAYRDGRDTADAIKQVCGVDVTAFEAGYKVFVKELAAKLRGRPPEKPLTLAQLQAAVAKDPRSEERRVGKECRSGRVGDGG